MDMEMKGGGERGHGKGEGVGGRADEGRGEEKGEGWGAEIQAGFRACLNQAGTKLTNSRWCKFDIMILLPFTF